MAGIAAVPNVALPAGPAVNEKHGTLTAPISQYFVCAKSAPGNNIAAKTIAQTTNFQLISVIYLIPVPAWPSINIAAIILMIAKAITIIINPQTAPVMVFFAASVASSLPRAITYL